MVVRGVAWLGLAWSGLPGYSMAWRGVRMGCVAAPRSVPLNVGPVCVAGLC